MKKRFLAYVAVLSLGCSASLPAIAVDYSVPGVTTHPDFALSVFPVAIEVKFTLPEVKMLPSNTTSLSFTMNAGYTPRRLSQNPKTGDYLQWDENGKTILTNPGTVDFIMDSSQADYSALFSSWSLAVTQGFSYSPITKGDLVTATFSFDGHWEQAMERLEASRHDSWASDDKLTFTGPDGNGGINTHPIFSGTLTGTPDLQGNRYMLSTSLNLSMTVNLQTSTPTTIDGISMNLSGTWAPRWLFNDFNMLGGKSDYWKVSASLSFGRTLYQSQQKNGLNRLSIVLTDHVAYHYLDGGAIPKFAEIEGIWGVSSQNLNHTVTNSLRLYLYGPQFISEESYPYMYAFLEVGYAGGHLNNTNHQISYGNFMGSAGVHVHLQLFGIFHVYYETGYVFGPEINNEAAAVWPGTVGFYVNLD